MTQANDSITVTPGTGATVATHIPSGASKEYQAVVIAGSSGHLDGTVPSYLMAVDGIDTAAGAIQWDLWNGSASNILKIHGIWVVAATDVTNGNNVGMRMDLIRTSSVGTGGTTASYNASVTTNANITPMDSSNAALPSGVSARHSSTGGATSSSWLLSTYHMNEEISVPSYMSEDFNILPTPSRGVQGFRLNPSEGLKLVKANDNSTGQFGYLISFSVE